MGRILSFRPQIEKLAHLYSAHHPDPELMSSVIGELVVGISSYQEEWTKNVPLVFIVSDLREFLRQLMGNDPIEIGGGILNRTTLRTILKTCGPLAQNQEWAIYIEVKNRDLHYGLFRTDRFPLHESTFQRLRNLNCEETHILGIQKIGESLIEIRNARNQFHYIDSSGLLEFSQNPTHLISQWVSALTETVPTPLKKKMDSFYDRIAIETLTAPHGTLAAIIQTNTPYPEFLLDGVILKRDFGLTDAIQRYLKKRDEAAALSLSSYASLIKKMLAMDGITVFNNSGNVLAYNCFVKEISPRHPNEIVLGGARKRAFELLSRKIGGELTCALYQSQDGYGQCRTAKPRA
jgi:hypothetical protein